MWFFEFFERYPTTIAFAALITSIAALFLSGFSMLKQNQISKNQFKKSKLLEMKSLWVPIVADHRSLIEVLTNYVEVGSPVPKDETQQKINKMLTEATNVYKKFEFAFSENGRASIEKYVSDLMSKDVDEQLYGALAYVATIDDLLNSELSEI